MRGVATLRDQSRCPFRGFAETRLATAALEKPVPGFNARERGDMLHRALELIWGALGTWERLATMPSADREALLHDAVIRAIAQQCRRRDPGMRWQRRERPRLTALLEKWLATERERAPFSVERLESGAATARHGGLEFPVRIDRIDRLPDGGRILIDYKTGAAEADWRGERPDNPQLPIYALLEPVDLVAVAYGKVNAGECGFVAETARGGLFKPRGKPTALEGMPDFASLLALWAQRLDRIAAEFAAGAADVRPTPHACASCALKPLCRIPGVFSDEPPLDD
jgi:RecB family exonuclease